jgi:hypothetical protein
VSRNKGGSKTPLFALNYGSIHVITWIFIQSMWFEKGIFNFEKNLRVRIKHWNCSLNKSIVIVETNNHWKYQIWAWNDEQIFDFVVDEIDVVILPFRAILAYPIIPKHLY